MAAEPLSLIDAEKLAKAIVKSGTVTTSQHARTELAKDKLIEADAINVIRGGYCEGRDLERGTWRYRMKTSSMK